MSEPGPVVLIFGRRSGTSSLAKVLVELGYPVRGPLDCRPFPAQPDGHYENTFARSINHAILSNFNMKPGVPGLVPFQKCSPLDAWASRHPESFIVKDPGLDMAWPVWVRTLSPRKILGIWCWRKPGEREESLRRNYSIPPDNAHWAVTMYDLCVEAATKHIDTIEATVHEPFRVKRVTSWLDVHGVLPNMDAPKARMILGDETDSQMKDERPCLS